MAVFWKEMIKVGAVIERIIGLKDSIKEKIIRGWSFLPLGIQSEERLWGSESFYEQNMGA